MIEPTGEQCTNGEQMPDINGMKAFALWYPQMGGYVAKCVVAFHDENDDNSDRCFEAYVWHNGEFPFNKGENPAKLHHCSANQFIDFGEAVKYFQNGNKDDGVHVIEM